MHFKILQTIDASGFLTALESTRFVFGRGSALDFAGGSYSVPPNPVYSCFKGALLVKEGR